MLWAQCTSKPLISFHAHYPAVTDMRILFDSLYQLQWQQMGTLHCVTCLFLPFMSRSTQVAVELLKLAADHGLDSWVDPRLNKKPYSISGVTKQQLPSSGILTVTFVAKHKPSWEATPLTDAEFGSMWTMLVDPARLSTAAAVLEQELNVMDFGYGVKRSSGLWAGGVGHQGLLQQQQQQQQAGDCVFVTQSAGVLARDWEVPTSRANSPPAAAAVFAAKNRAQPARGSFLASSHAGQQDCTGSNCPGPRLNSSCSQYCGIPARSSCFGGLEYGSIAGSALAGISSSSSPGGDVGAGVHLHAVTDGWKMELLQVWSSAALILCL